MGYKIYNKILERSYYFSVYNFKWVIVTNCPHTECPEK